MSQPQAVPAWAAPPKLLAGLDEKSVSQIMSAAQSREVAPKRPIISGGQQATHLFLLKTGTVRYYRLEKSGDEVLLGWLVAGDTFGLGSFLKQPTRYVGNADSVTQTELLVWDHRRIQELAQSYPQIAENSLRIALEYLRVFADKHVGLVSQGTEQRLANSLLSLAHRAGKTHSEGVDVEVTNEQLSELANTSPFTACRLLRKWKDAGIVSKGRGKIVIHAPETLVMD